MSGEKSRVRADQSGRVQDLAQAHIAARQDFKDEMRAEFQSMVADQKDQMQALKTQNSDQRKAMK